MTNPKGKKTIVPISKKRKGAAPSLGLTTVIRHPFLQFPLGPQEELFQILWARPLERHRKGVISIDPYVTRLARMIERQRGFDPPQYRLIHSTDQEDRKDIVDDDPPPHEDPASQPPPIHRPVHAAGSLSNISEYLTRFEQ
ncbi:hypothetical protein GOBAR_AA18154 [Gossypium barbadense]|uniref:Uncharacterized protein n=1 Tax=Gossypium barbadense TaxID=3634 RepID=A0A2P5XGQ3_GOSBA|nr:hypothetical protein GOBAR_AA18154 [Gossypium barbadense]